MNCSEHLNSPWGAPKLKKSENSVQCTADKWCPLCNLQGRLGVAFAWSLSRDTGSYFKCPISWSECVLFLFLSYYIKFYVGLLIMEVWRRRLQNFNHYASIYVIEEALFFNIIDWSITIEVLESPYPNFHDEDPDKEFDIIWKKQEKNAFWSRYWTFKLTSGIAS